MSRGEEGGEGECRYISSYAFVRQSHLTIITNLLLATSSRVEEAHRTN